MTRRLLSALPSALAVLIAVSPAIAKPLTIALNADIRSSNPGVNRDDNTDGVILNVVEGLVAYAEDARIKPLLAKSFEVSNDGLTYTFSLREGVKFHNGAEMTAADVLWSWNRYMDPKTEWRCLPEFDGRNRLKVVFAEAPDAHTFVMKLNEPSALFLATMARTDCAMTAILQKDSMKADGSWDKPIGTGPFMFGEWKRGEYVTLKRFHDYQSPPGDKPDGYVGSKRPLIDEAKFLIVPDAATVKAALVGGSLDVAQVADSDVAELKQSPGLDISTPQVATKHTFLFQTRDPLLSNVKLRQAIAAALDMKQIVAAASNGLGSVNNSAVPPTSAYYDDVQRQGYSYDPQRAKALLAEAGYKGEEITILANQRVAMPSYPAAVMAQAMMQAAGINARIEVLEWATQLDRYQTGKYQMQSFSYSSRLDPALSYEQFSGPKDEQPRKVWENPKALDLIDQAYVVSNEEKRRNIFDELHRMMIEGTPLIILYNGVDSVAYSKGIQGYSTWEGKPRLWEVSVAD
jgi:peptide/nickel transport system substrate-binding protein